MYLKLHAGQNGNVLALCDRELIGSKITDGRRTLDLVLYADFYKGEKANEAEAVRALTSAANANIVGRKSLAAACKAGLDISGAIMIGGVPHLQAYRI